MKWSDIGKQVLGLGLPLLGSVFAGPAGSAAGQAAARALGVDPTPEAVSAAIAADVSEAALRLREMETRHEQELTRLLLETAASDIREVNATMRVEASSDKWWVSGWRPYWGFASATAWAFLAICVGWAVARGEGSVVIDALASLDAFWFVPLVICGAASYHRGMEKRQRAGEPRVGGVLGALAERIKGGAR